MGHAESCINAVCLPTDDSDKTSSHAKDSNSPTQQDSSDIPNKDKEAEDDDDKTTMDPTNNNDDKKTDDWADTKWDDDDDLNDLAQKYPLPNVALTRNESLPPNLGARISHNKIELKEPDAQLQQYTICNQSDRPQSFTEPTQDYGGLVLYQYDGKREWSLNGIQCQTGVVLLKRSADLPKSSVGQIHGGLYKTFFNESVNTKIVASGFAYYNKKWVFKSRAFNLEANAHVMRDSEIIWLKKALQNWCDHGAFTTKVDPVLHIYIQEKGEYKPKKV